MMRVKRRHMAPPHAKSSTPTPIPCALRPPFPIVTCTYFSVSPRSRRNTEAQSRKNQGAPECSATDLGAAG